MSDCKNHPKIGQDCNCSTVAFEKAMTDAKGPTKDTFSVVEIKDAPKFISVLLRMAVDMVYAALTTKKTPT